RQRGTPSEPDADRLAALFARLSPVGSAGARRLEMVVASDRGRHAGQAGTQRAERPAIALISSRIPLANSAHPRYIRSSRLTDIQRRAPQWEPGQAMRH